MCCWSEHQLLVFTTSLFASFLLFLSIPPVWWMLLGLAQIPLTRDMVNIHSCCECWLLVAHSFQRIAQSQRVAALPERKYTASVGTKIHHFAWRWANSVVQLPLQNSPRDQAPAETTACLASSPAPSCFPHPPSHWRTLSINCVWWLCF